MHLSEITIDNFRIFGAKSEGQHFHTKFRSGMNVVVGENDTGKSALIDAIRFVLMTTSGEYPWLTPDDFHVVGDQRASTLSIQCVFRDLSTRESAAYLEWLSVDDGLPCLYVTLQAMRLDEGVASGRQRVALKRRAAKNAEGPSIEGEVREFLRSTYLRPLRDAEAELSAGRGSRLSQILHASPDCSDQKECSFDDEAIGTCQPFTLVEIMRQAEHRITENAFIRSAQADLNEQYLKDFAIGEDALEGKIGIARHAELRHILEKLELWLQPRSGVSLRTSRGLGVNNVLFMATELLLLGRDETTLPLLLIEEPEAHLHPQLQIRLMEFLADKAADENGAVQIIMTSHSPNLASKADLESVIVMCENGQAYSLESSKTKLETSDYRFLRRFLDVTKSNFFFAKGVAIVEGDTENILLPTLAELIGRSFSKNGVSIVKVGSRGLLRYSRIFQRTDGATMPVRVACITDRDIVPDTVDYAGDTEMKESDITGERLAEYLAGFAENDSDAVKTFVSPHWTLEYDLAISGLARHLHIAAQLAAKASNKGFEREKVIEEANKEFDSWQESKLPDEELAAKVYEPLKLKRASKAETAQFLAELLELDRPTQPEMRGLLPDYLVDAINYITRQDG